jgi:hypothetical protein
VQFERISRYNIKLEICEEGQADIPNCNNSPAYDTFGGSSVATDKDNVQWLDPRLQDFFQPGSDSKAGLQDGRASSWVPSYTSTPRSKTGNSREQTYESINSEPCARQAGKIHPCSRTNTDDVQCCATSKLAGESWAHTFSHSKTNSPSKRKIWDDSAPKSTTNLRVAMARLEDHVDLDVEADAKRRKLKPADDTYIHIAAEPTQTTCWDDSDEALDHHTMKSLTDLDRTQTSPTSDNPSWFQKRQDRPSKREPTPHPSTSGNPAPSTQQTTPSPDSSLPDKSPTSLWSTYQELRIHLPQPSSSPANDTKPLATASASTSASNSALSQEQIQHNYLEFEERKKRKAAEKAYYAATVPGFDGIVSPTEEDNKKFEHMFLNESDASDWVGEDDDDGISEGLGSVCLDEC